MDLGDQIRTDKIKKLENLFYAGDMKAVIQEADILIKEYNSGTAFNILALAHKRLGNYTNALSIYENLLLNNPRNTLFLGNLGNIYTDIGKLDKAESCFKKCLEIDSENFNVSISLANIYATKAKFDSALSIFNQILTTSNNLSAKQLGNLNYRIAEVYRSKGRDFFDNAIHHYGLSDEPLSSAHQLELIYRIKDFNTFIKAEEKINDRGDLNPLLSAVQTHASIRYNKPNNNRFCKNPLKYIEHSKLTDGEGFNIDLVNNLLIVKNTFDKTPQALLTNGQQSAGNFLLSDEPSVLRIKNIIMNRVKRYRDSYMDSDEGFIKNWPQNTNLYGWIIELNKGGNLRSHMHKLGWLSGSLYLQLKKIPRSNQGNIVFDLHGADYPKDSKIFPNIEFDIEQGDIILFPSSIFHKTIPFDLDENRITLAFDIKPIY